jgi:hypothetical protein
MADVVPIQTGKPATVATEISYCPNLDVYHYVRFGEDEADYMFTTPQLEKAIETYIKQGDPRQAEFMAILTALARRFPHKKATFDEQGQCYMSDLEPVPPPSADEPDDGPDTDNKT